MNLLLYIPSKTADEWQAAFARALPQAELRAWTPGLDWQADYAAFWYPPRDLLDRQTRLKAAFNLGAGVDATLKALALPPGVPLVRLEDAGMGRQMDEYVGWAVLRHFRRLDEYAAQQSRAEWKVHGPRRHDEFTVGMMGLGVLGTRVARAVLALGFPVWGWSASAKSVEGEAHSGGLAAPMPGKVIAVLVAAGASVERGAPLVIMEAMKMEHTITAPGAGTVKEILYAVGEQVAEGAELIRFDAA